MFIGTESLNTQTKFIMIGFNLVALMCRRRVISLNETRTVEVLMVTTAKGNWTFPKGLVDVGLTQDEVAAKEVLEEAGAKGRLLRRQPYRSFCYTKHEWNNTICEVTLDTVWCMLLILLAIAGEIYASDSE